MRTLNLRQWFRHKIGAHHFAPLSLNVTRTKRDAARVPEFTKVAAAPALRRFAGVQLLCRLAGSFHTQFGLVEYGEEPRGL